MKALIIILSSITTIAFGQEKKDSVDTVDYRKVARQEIEYKIKKQKALDSLMRKQPPTQPKKKKPQ